MSNPGYEWFRPVHVVTLPIIGDTVNHRDRALGAFHDTRYSAGLPFAGSWAVVS